MHPSDKLTNLWPPTTYFPEKLPKTTQDQSYFCPLLSVLQYLDKFQVIA